jgi:hypothetical protein
MASTGTRLRCASNSRAHCQLAGQPGVRGRSEGRGLFVAHVLPRHGAGTSQRVGETVQAVARQAVDTLDTADSKRGDDVVGDGRHGRLLVGDFGVFVGAERGQNTPHSLYFGANR